VTGEGRRRAPHIHTRDLAWGPPEPAELGPVHDATREGLLAALALPQAGEIYDLDAGRWHGMPMAGGIHAPFTLTRWRTAQGGAVEGDAPRGGRGGFAINAEVNTTGHHAGTHIDALCHIGAGDDAHWFGGYTAEEHGGDFGWRRADASTMPPILARGVLLDVAAHRGVDALGSGSPVDAAEVQAILDAQGTTVRPGDVVLVRTGYMAYWPHDLEGAGQHFSAGLTPDAAVVLADMGAVVIGSDTEGLEVLPEVDPDDVFPVHIALLVERGVHIAELLYLEDLARDERREFLFVCLPLRIRGATASMVRPVAVV
jgi:kynurenine formamidase